MYAVLARVGYSRLRDADRLSGVPVRYVRDHPGALIHQDHKKLGRPDGGGHRLLGRTAGSRGRGQLGYDHFEVVVDDATRLAYVAHVPNESAVSASRALLDAAVWFAERGVRIERVMTDDAWACTSPTFGRAVESLDARHKRIRPHRPRTNGKAERFIKTLVAEWAHGRLYRTNQERLDALPSWAPTTTPSGPTPLSAASPRWRRYSTTSMGITPSPRLSIALRCAVLRTAARQPGERPRRLPAAGGLFGEVRQLARLTSTAEKEVARALRLGRAAVVLESVEGLSSRSGALTGSSETPSSRPRRPGLPFPDRPYALPR